MGRDRDRRRAAAAQRIWTERVRQRVLDAVPLDPSNRELQRLIELGLVTVDQCIEANEAGALFYSPSRRAFINLEQASSDETPDLT